VTLSRRFRPGLGQYTQIAAQSPDCFLDQLQFGLVFQLLWFWFEGLHQDLPVQTQFQKYQTMQGKSEQLCTMLGILLF